MNTEIELNIEIEMNIEIDIEIELNTEIYGMCYWANLAVWQRESMPCREILRMYVEGVRNSYKRPI